MLRPMIIHQIHSKEREGGGRFEIEIKLGPISGQSQSHPQHTQLSAECFTEQTQRKGALLEQAHREGLISQKWVWSGFSLSGHGLISEQGVWP